MCVVLGLVRARGESRSGLACESPVPSDDYRACMDEHKLLFRLARGAVASVAALRSEAGGSAVSDYHTNVFYSNEDAAYVADIPDLEACSALGASPEEALAEVERAKEAWLSAAREVGKPIPEPRYRPAICAR
jgi:predicted RNase H-like HicB family nuclease